MYAVGISVLFLVSLQLTVAQEDTLTLGTWNIQNFGVRKADSAYLLRKIVQIIGKHDIISVQELSNRNNEAIKKLFKELLKEFPKKQYAMVVSPFVGTGGFSEQYGVFYSDLYFHVEVLGVYPGPKQFKRNPYCVTVKPKDSGMIDFGMCMVHTAPEMAVLETNNLADVADWYRSLTGVEDVMILGDFNCGCEYVKAKDYEQIELYTREEFHWLVATCADTTVKESTSCPYDRIVVAGPNMFRTIVAESTDIFNYQKWYSLNDSIAESISDHFPVNLKLKKRIQREWNNTLYGGTKRYTTNYPREWNNTWYGGTKRYTTNYPREWNNTWYGGTKRYTTSYPREWNNTFYGGTKRYTSSFQRKWKMTTRTPGRRKGQTSTIYPFTPHMNDTFNGYFGWNYTTSYPPTNSSSGIFSKFKRTFL